MTESDLNATGYRVIAWWTHPGDALPGEVQLPDGWSRCFEIVSFADPDDVATFLRSHPDAWDADVVSFETRGDENVPTARFAGEKTIAGWIMSHGKLAEVPVELPDDATYRQLPVGHPAHVPAGPGEPQVT